MRVVCDFSVELPFTQRVHSVATKDSFDSFRMRGVMFVFVVAQHRVDEGNGNSFGSPG
jgi:hypothetical protein